MPLADFWGASVDRSVAGRVTVSLIGVSASGTTDLEAAKNLVTGLQSVAETSDDPLWQKRCAYAIAAWKVAEYTKLRNASSGATRTKYTTKLNTWQAILPVARTEAGE